MKTLRNLLCLGLALSLIGVGCKKKGEGTAAPEEKKPGTEAAATEAGKPATAPEGDKAGPAAEPTPAMKLLDTAIAARGGLDKIQATDSWTGKSKGVYMGMPYESTNTCKGGEMRMDIKMPGGIMPWVMGAQNCWSKNGDVVIPCAEADKKEAQVTVGADRAMALWPLKQGNWKLDLADPNTLVAKSDSPAVEVKLEFNPESKMLVKATYKGTLMGQEGEFVATPGEPKEFCGAKVPGSMKITFAGNPYLEEETLEGTCGPVDPKVFEQPQQVADGTFVERDTTPLAAACLTHKGAYEEMGKGYEKLMGLLQKQKLNPAGGAIAIYTKMGKNPKQHVTELCFPVAKPPKKLDKKAGFQIKNLKPEKVLSLYGIGDYQKKSPEMAKNLLGEVAKRKLKTAGPMRQIMYMEPQKTSPEQCVAEMQLPIKGGAKKKGK